MNACMSLLVHSTQMGHDNSTEFPVFNWITGLIDDFGENMALGNVVVPGVFCAGEPKRRKFRRPVEIADNLNPLSPSSVYNLRVECAARS